MLLRHEPHRHKHKYQMSHWYNYSHFLSLFLMKNNKSSFFFPFRNSVCLLLKKAKWMRNENRKLRGAINIPLMTSAYPNTGLKRERMIVYKFHKWKSNNWKCNCVWIYRCLLRCSDDSRLWYLLLNFPAWWIFSFMWSYRHANARCIHRVISGFSFDVESERQMKETTIVRGTIIAL